MLRSCASLEMPIKRVQELFGIVEFIFRFSQVRALRYNSAFASFKVKQRTRVAAVALSKAAINDAEILLTEKYQSRNLPIVQAPTVAFPQRKCLSILSILVHLSRRESHMWYVARARTTGPPLQIDLHIRSIKALMRYTGFRCSQRKGYGGLHPDVNH